MRIVLLTVLVLLGIASEAAAHIRVAVDATSRRGLIDLYGIVSRDMPTATFYELIDGRDKKLMDVTPAPWYDDADHGPLGFAIEPAAAVWRCDRLYRTFVIVGRYPDGSIGERGVFSVRTPSCRHRLALKAPRRATPGDRITLRLRDTFGTGGIRARACLSGVCEGVLLGDGQKRARLRLRVRDRTGIRPLTLTAPGQVLEQSIAVGVRPTDAVASGPTILTTGDSLMQSVDSILSDRLDRRANVVSDVRIASGLSRSTVVDYPTLAKQQVKRHKPAATAIFLGANDTYSMYNPDGIEVVCCGTDWEDEYSRRAKELMETYTQNGTATVAWLAVPAMRDERRNPAKLAVNSALRRAAVQVPGAYVVPTDKLLTPRGVFEPTLERGGRQVPVREDDGIHLTIAGARIAVAAVVKVLGRAKVI